MAEFDAVRAACDRRSVLIGGGARGRLVDPGTVAAITAGVAASWPLILTDIGSGAGRVRGHLESGTPSLLVLVCRLSAVEIRETADFLRVVHRVGLLDVHQAAVVAVVAGSGRRFPDGSAAMAAVSDTAAGVDRVSTSAALARRDAVVHDVHVDGAVELLAAAIAAAPV